MGLLLPYGLRLKERALKRQVENLVYGLSAAIELYKIEDSYHKPPPNDAGMGSEKLYKALKNKYYHFKETERLDVYGIIHIKSAWGSRIKYRYPGEDKDGDSEPDKEYDLECVHPDYNEGNPREDYIVTN
jgi:hypothetical protein